MSIWDKILIGAGVSGGIYAGYKYFSNLKRTSAELESVSSLKIHRLDLNGLIIRVDVQLKNPAGSAFKIKYPFVKLIYKDAMIGSSQVLDKDIQIKPFGEVHIDQIMINVPIMGIFSIGAGLHELLINKKPVKILCKTISTIDLGWQKIPYEKTQEQTLTR